MSTIWHKVWRDLKLGKARTALVVLSITVGVFALGVVFGLYGVLREQIMGPYRAALPAHITFGGGPFSEETVDAVAREPGIAAAEGELHDGFEWKLAGEKWRDADVVARADFDAQQMNLLRLREGRWPDDPAVRLASPHALAIECLSADQLDIPVGTTLLVKIGERERPVPVEGVDARRSCCPPTGVVTRCSSLHPGRPPGCPAPAVRTTLTG